MTRFKLTPYTIRIRRKKDDTYLNLDDFDSMDMYDVILRTIEDLKKTQIDRDSNKTISTQSLYKQNREIMGILKVGDYGIGADFYNVKDRKLTEDARTTDDSEVLPFFFHFVLPRGKNCGLLILQTFSYHSIKGILSSKLRERKEFSDYMLELKRMISDKALKALMEGDLLSISFVRHSIPKDVGNQIGKAGRTDIEEVRTFKVKGNFQLSDKLRDALKNTKMKYYEILDEKYDEAKAVVKIGKSEIVLIFGEENKFNEFMPLDDYDTLVNGFPKYEYILEKSSMYISDLENVMEG